MKAARSNKPFVRRLLRWYAQHHRDLPWRGERDAYRIWISEVMLQQTRVAVVIERYQEFLRHFPTVQKLARARLADVLAAWSGLGYYRRARALHVAAKMIVEEHRGALPRDAENLRQLPGIGRYTAAAIASIAFDEPVAVVDGNVERVLARICGTAQRDCWARANDLLPRECPGDFNQAMMELGATVCLPGRPLCSQCPVRAFCRARGRLKQRAINKRQKGKVSYALLRKGDSVALVQRSATASLMPEMWELPQVPRTSEQGPLLTVRHSITNTDYHVTVCVAPTAMKPVNARWVPLRTTGRLPLTGLTRKILTRLATLT
jgi:A/G-specific adenine glycosylase